MSTIEKTSSMKNVLFMAALFALYGCVEAPSTENNVSTPEEKQVQNQLPQVALFGSFHFAGSNDLVSMNVPDLDSDQRQKEILAIVDSLANYHPTKILVEFPPSRQTKYDSLYNAYLAGAHELSIGETQQLGFRLAKKLDLPGVIGIDYNLDLPFGEWFLEAQAFDSTKFEQVLTNFRAKGDEAEAFIAEHTMMDFFVKLNSTQADNENKQFYFEVTTSVVPDTSSTAMDMAAAWWERNLFWMRNIDQQIGPEDRVLVICGSGHRSVLVDFYRSRSDVQYVEIADFLK